MHQTNQIYLCSDYSAGFGGRYGVQEDRMDKVGITTIQYFHLTNLEVVSP